MIRWNKKGPAQLGTDQAKPGKEKVFLDKIKEIMIRWNKKGPAQLGTNQAKPGKKRFFWTKSKRTF